MSWRMCCWGVGIALLVSSCATPPEQDGLSQQKNRALAELAKLDPGNNSGQQNATITHSPELYVPAAGIHAEHVPVWFSKPVVVNASGVGFHELLADVFASETVSLGFSQPELRDHPLHLQFSGSLGELLQRLADHTGWHFTHNDHRVHWSRWRTAEFDVAFIAGATKFFMGNREMTQKNQQQSSAQSATGALAAAGAAGSEQYSNFSNTELSVWDDLERALRLLLSEQGVLSMNQSSTSVLVKDKPHHVVQIEHYLRQQNERLTRQVAIEVQIIEVSFRDEEQLAVDWQALARTAGGNAVLGLGSSAFGGLGEELGGQLFWQRKTGRTAGSELFIEALQEQGLVQISNQPRLLSLNNQIAKIALQDNATYLASAGTTSTVNVGVTTTLQPGLVSTGFELYVLPSIRDGEVILQLSTELSDLLRIDEVRSGEQLIQTPHTNRKQFFMQAVVGDGQTLLLSGLRNERQQRTEQQSWLSFLLGGKQQQQQQQSETLVLLTPTIIAREAGS
ncbi:hypothetical protein J6I75_03845 [Pseudidiomarina sp. 1APP75-27a]|uniref:hypothetical protein n=1 Tax=Pseudidiomarina terrestris TaxID=2820060 RepID=UPI002B05B0D2|nr:hypothetical protein [Pseudidiomarina sp. 1APP75-27a]MEA3587477.1 hypothetical protein [Pseudidiomarina sp. 1APP75-27a]